MADDTSIFTAEELKAIATEPQEMEEDGVKAKRYSLEELIKLDQYVKGIQAKSNNSPFFGCSLSLLSPPGSTGST